MDVLKPFDPWKNPLCTCPQKYSLHPYTGCSFKCLYCYATSYIKQKSSIPKNNFVKRLLKDLLKANPELPVSISNSSDPYPPIDELNCITRVTLKILLTRGFNVQIITKSFLVIRDIDLLSKYNASVSITLTTLNENLAKIIEPYAPSPSIRIKTIKILLQNKIPVSVRIDPIIPYVNDDPYEIEKLVKELSNLGVNHIVTSTYKVKLDNFKRITKAFPPFKNKLKKLYFTQGTFIHGYFYLPKKLRMKLLKPIVETARLCGLTYATCREGLISKEFFNSPTCDGTHLIPKRTYVKKVMFNGS